MQIEVIHPIEHGMIQDGRNVVLKFARGIYDVPEAIGNELLKARDAGAMSGNRLGSAVLVGSRWDHVNAEEFARLQAAALKGDYEAFEKLKRAGAIARPYVKKPEAVAVHPLPKESQPEVGEVIPRSATVGR